MGGARTTRYIWLRRRRGSKANIRVKADASFGENHGSGGRRKGRNQQGEIGLHGRVHCIGYKEASDILELIRRTLRRLRGVGVALFLAASVLSFGG